MQLADIREVKRGALTGVLLRLLGKRLWGIRLTEAGVVLLARSPREVSFRELAGPLKQSRTFGIRGLTLTMIDGSTLHVAGLRQEDSVSFVEAANQAWRRSIAELFEIAGDELKKVAEAVERLQRPRRYPSACLLQPFLKRSQTLAAWLPKAVPEDVVSTKQLHKWNAISRFQESAEQTRDAAINEFIDAELVQAKDFFDTIEANPLTPEQRLAVITDEDATLVLAGAGSGKTSVIVSKAAYLIQRSIRQPGEILLLAFGKDAAEEMSKRIEQRCGSPVDARTFHALGYEIIREVEGQGPALAQHASDEGQFRDLMREILINEVVKNVALGVLVLRWFSEFYWPYKSEWDFTSKDEYYRYVEAHELRTLQGELVRSFEELQIANWLYLNGITYEYEPTYEHPLPENNRRAYTPDFRLTDSGVYIEHFGVRKERGPSGTTHLTTAPYVDRECYLEGMEWKRKVHESHDTTLIETYSYERVEGNLLESLEEKLAPYVTPSPIPPEQILDTLTQLGQVDPFTSLLGTFLRHFKSTGRTIGQCHERAKTSDDPWRSLAFLKIFEACFEGYQGRLGERIDFEDMIVRATEHVREGRYQSPYRHLLVDEFQDISDGRAQLLLALKAQHPDARIFAVGDDWQSIYRFTGSDIRLLRNFGATFGGQFAGSDGVHSAVDLGRTFRSVDKIALPARSFILKNPSQIEKQIVPAGMTDAPAIKVVYYTRVQEALRAAFEEIERPLPSTDTTSVLLLGRYRFVQPDNPAQFRANHPRLSIRFMTIHGSKGLEADHVILLGATSGRFGFPSEIVDDPILDLVLPEPEQFEHAEERRLFYVALTRARKSVTILADRVRPSVFVRELIDDPEHEIIELGLRAAVKRRCSACGGQMLANASNDGRVYFSCEHQFLCGEMLRACSACNADLPVKSGSKSEALVCNCGARFPACPDCDEGWLVERDGRYGRFLGCVNYPSCKGSRNLRAR